MAKHYIAMSGSSGCLPDFCEPFQKRKEAVDALGDLHEMTRKEKEALRSSGYVTLTVGADYAEVKECQCVTPGIHTESGVVDWA